MLNYSEECCDNNFKAFSVSETFFQLFSVLKKLIYILSGFIAENICGVESAQVDHFYPRIISTLKLVFFQQYQDLKPIDDLQDEHLADIYIGCFLGGKPIRY